MEIKTKCKICGCVIGVSFLLSCSKCGSRIDECISNLDNNPDTVEIKHTATGFSAYVIVGASSSMEVVSANELGIQSIYGKIKLRD